MQRWAGCGSSASFPRFVGPSGRRASAPQESSTEVWVTRTHLGAGAGERSCCMWGRAGAGARDRADEWPWIAPDLAVAVGGARWPEALLQLAGRRLTRRGAGAGQGDAARDRGGARQTSLRYANAHEDVQLCLRCVAISSIEPSGCRSSGGCPLTALCRCPTHMALTTPATFHRKAPCLVEVHTHWQLVTKSQARRVAVLHCLHNAVCTMRAPEERRCGADNSITS
ncbi:hypothetical protein BV25DRAFT_1373262 [Artomyces pyxidatus]|uniref:Uncharacterized protein n=1 Tax=Artomyces pyxidatus TaxID=48021 RepID=A0ACB8TC72_9AGAM|nr:hypothetical protein BV25DRAFT_1373262 [Artomyces pyxidatus]